jgi:sodium-independent sulfate anion transporter 11
MANLPPYYGLYTVLIGIVAYPLFGTSKDVSLGKEKKTFKVMKVLIAHFLFFYLYRL